MKNNDNPIFALLPDEVLLKAKLLAEQFRFETELENVVGRNVLILIAAIVLLLLINGANALVFMTMAISLIGSTDQTMTGIVRGYALVAWLGGTICMFNAIMAWLEVIAFRRANPSLPLVKERMRFYKRFTWIPLIPLLIIPAAFNFLFSLKFFLVTVSALLVSAILLTLKSDA